MSGIIHINGKDYDEEGNPIKSVRSTPKFVDGIVSSNKNLTKINKVTPASITQIPKSSHQTTGRSILTPPTEKVKKSVTLNRLAVKKPSSLQSKLDPVVNHAIIKKTNITYSDVSVAKHSSVTRLAKVPAHTVEQNHKDSSTINTYIPRRKTEDMIQAQLEAATAHLMTFKKPNLFHHAKKRLNKLSKPHRRLVTSSALATLSLVFGAIIIYSNMPKISITIASRKAGFSALLPSFTPNGYRAITPVGYSSGKIVVNFASNTNDMKYTIEQKPTGWSSETLREQVTSSNGSQYQTQYANGLTIFFTADDTATWVDRGILFNFTGNSGLSVDQIASIAASM